MPTSLARKTEPESEEKWIARLIARLQSPDDAPERVVISAGASKTKMARQCTIRLTPETTVAGLVSDIDQAISASGYQLGKVEAFRAGDRTPEVVRVWQIPARDDEPEMPDEAERDTPAAATAGLLRQAYQHNETFLKMMQGMMGETLHHFRDITATLKDEVRQARTENVALLRQLSTREDERLERETVRNREMAIADAFKNVVSAVAVRLSNGASAAPELVKLLESLTSDQQDAILAQLNDSQRTLLVSLLQTADEQKGKK